MIVFFWEKICVCNRFGFEWFGIVYVFVFVECFWYGGDWLEVEDCLRIFSIV